MKGDSRPKRLAELIVFAKRQLLVARVAGLSQRAFAEHLEFEGAKKPRQNVRRNYLRCKEEARCARKLAKRTLLEIEVINGQIFYEEKVRVVPLRSSLDGRNFQTWWHELALARAHVWGTFK